MDSNNSLFILFLAFEGLSVWGGLEDLTGKQASRIWHEFRDSLGDGSVRLKEVIVKYEETKKRVADVRKYEASVSYSRCSIPVAVAGLFLFCLLSLFWPENCGVLCIVWTTILIVIQLCLFIRISLMKAAIKKRDPEEMFAVELPTLGNGADGRITRL